MPNFSIPLSGLAAESTALSAIANNLSNQNTTGYKDTSVLFSDLFYQNLGTTGAGDPIQLGSGAQVQEMPANFTPREHYLHRRTHRCGHSRKWFLCGTERGRHQLYPGG